MQAKSIVVDEIEVFTQPVPKAEIQLDPIKSALFTESGDFRTLDVPLEYLEATAHYQ